MEDDLTPAPPAPPPAFGPPPPPDSLDWSIPGGPVQPPSRRRRTVAAAMALIVAGALAVSMWPSSGGSQSPAAVAAADPGTVTVVAGTPASIDPARHGDLGSASYVSQLYETLTAVDPSLTVRPALAESWAIGDDGRQVTFTLRDGLEFSDGSPLTAADVVHSWRRLFDPAHPSPLASLIADVKGARDLLSGASTDVTTLGVRADGDRTVIVDMERGGGDLPGHRVGRPVRGRAAVSRRGRDHPGPRHARRERRLHARQRRARCLRALGEPALLGGQARDRDRPDAHRPQGPEPGRRVRGGRRRRDASGVRGRRLARL